MTMKRRFGPQTWYAVASILAVLAVYGAAARAQEAGTGVAASHGFVGDGKCGNPKCHGAGLPSSPEAKKSWKPWTSARTQWLNSNIDHHSRAYRTLETAASKAIGGYMGIQPTASDKCLRCHAPEAGNAQGSTRKPSDGVTCEHCHGPAEQWLKPHVEKDWRDKQAQFTQLGFYDNADFRLRAQKCASCHTEIDHEIIAGGHPPLQFEMVAYAQIMKHWDDQHRLPEGAYSVDPTLWSVGQIVGLRRVLDEIAQRAGNSNYQGLGKFTHFETKECYQCHHKLVEDTVRQGQGHYAMVEAVMTAVYPERRDELTALWGDVVTAVQSNAEQAREKAGRMDNWLAPYEAAIAKSGVDRDATRKILNRITSSGDKLKGIRRFNYSRPETANVVRLDGVGLPWWYTTGAPEQTVLAIESLCEPAFPGKCGAGPGGIQDDLRKLLAAVDRFDYRPEQFAQSLGAINKKLFK
jgi:hypothetical protein